MVTMTLDKLTPTELLEMEAMASVADAASRIRKAGHGCRHVHRYWSDIDSDVTMAEGRVPIAIFEDGDGGLWTAAFTQDGVVVSAGW